MGRKKKEKKKPQWPKGLFMRLIVVFCIAYIVRIVERGIDISEAQGISPAPIVTAAIGFFGAELVMCVVKRIRTGNEKNAEETTTETDSSGPKKIDNDFKLPLG